MPLDGPTLLGLVGLGFLILMVWDRWKRTHPDPAPPPVADLLSEKAETLWAELRNQLQKAEERIGALETIIAADRAREIAYQQREIEWQAVYNTGHALYGIYTVPNAPPFPLPPGPRVQASAPPPRPNWANLPKLLEKMGDLIGSTQHERSTLLLAGITADYTKSLARSERVDTDLRMLCTAAQRWPPDVQEAFLDNIAAQVHESEWEIPFQEWKLAGRPI